MKFLINSSPVVQNHGNTNQTPAAYVLPHSLRDQFARPTKTPDYWRTDVSYILIFAFQDRKREKKCFEWNDSKHFGFNL
jgi:hypothetical protein